jgi:hypothetical protein
MAITNEVLAAARQAAAGHAEAGRRHMESCPGQVEHL